jgi:glycosyltransferase involved in cell wall biosynthesis
MLISVALATFNGERWLREQLDSLANQTLLPYELVISDDNSYDRTLEVVEDFAANAPFPIRIVRNDNRLGFADNFISALRHCTGEAVAFCDQDDVWLPSKLERCAAALHSNPGVMLVHHDCEEVDFEMRSFGIILRPRNSSDASQEPGFTVARISMLGCCMLLHRKTVKALCSYWPEAHLEYVRRTRSRGVLGHDLVALHVASALGSVHYLPEVLIQHRRHERNTWSPAISKRGKHAAAIDLPEQSRLLKETADIRTNSALMYTEMAKLADGHGDAWIARYFTSLAKRDSQLGRFCSGRAALYLAPSTIERLPIFLRMIRTGAYQGSLITATRCAAKDLMLALAGTRSQQLLEMVRKRLHLEFYPREAPQ